MSVEFCYTDLVRDKEQSVTTRTRRTSVYTLQIENVSIDPLSAFDASVAAGVPLTHYSSSIEGYASVHFRARDDEHAMSMSDHVLDALDKPAATLLTGVGYARRRVAVA